MFEVKSIIPIITKPAEAFITQLVYSEVVQHNKLPLSTGRDYSTARLRPWVIAKQCRSLSIRVPTAAKIGIEMTLDGTVAGL